MSRRARYDCVALADALVHATREGWFPDDGRFYYVAYTSHDGVGIEEELLTLREAFARADLMQRLTNARGNPNAYAYLVRTRDQDHVVYYAEGSPDGNNHP